MTLLLEELELIGKEKTKIPDSVRLKGDPVGQNTTYPLEYSDLRLVWELPSSYRQRWAEIAKEPLIKPEVHPDGKWRFLPTPASFTVLTVPGF
jgi:hypothetical protein